MEDQIRVAWKQTLERGFAKWQGGDRRKTASQFADWLGVKPTTLSSWWNEGVIPRDDDTIRKVAVRLGVEVYDILGLERPDPKLFFILQHWDDLSDDAKRAIIEKAEGFVAKNEAEAKRKRSPRAGTTG